MMIWSTVLANAEALSSRETGLSQLLAGLTINSNIVLKSAEIFLTRPFSFSQLKG